MTTRTARRTVTLAVVAALLALAACGGRSGNDADGPDVAGPVVDGAGVDGPGSGDSPTVGYQLQPAPDVGSIRLPDLTDGGRPFAFRADADSLLLVFFGFTNCPDVCPTTMANVRFALRNLGDTADRIDVAMVTVDPERDLEILPAYVSDFVPGAHALGTADRDELLVAANAFGASYTIGTTPDGDVDVGHTPYLYGVDDDGKVAITWSNEVSSDDLVADIRYVLGADA
ncbi:hypothetical protein BH20ACT4_BH20ACT4_11830 [soil metagenome]